MTGVGATDTRLIIWDDMINPWHNGGDPFYQIPSGGLLGDTPLVANDPGARTLNHTIVLSSWWYRDDDKRGKVQNSPRYFQKAGYRFFASTWYQKAGMLRWLETVKPEQTEGLIANTWDKNTDGVAAIACAGWNRRVYKACVGL
jgi:hypothetical protein